MSQNITIAELNPNVKGNFTLKFEVAEIASPRADTEQLECKIVDETGCIDAYFNKFGRFLKVGGVYELISLKCKVVEHSLRVQLRSDSKLIRIKHQFTFKDLFNNLSEKFYVSKEVQKSADPVKHQTNGAKKQQTNNVPSKVQKEIKTEQKKDNKQVKVQGKKEITNNGSNQQKAGRQSQRTSISYQDKKQSKNQLHKNEPPKKRVVYVQKQSKQANSLEENDKVERQNQQQRTFLKNIYKYQQRSVNLIVRILSETKIEYNKYNLIKVSDSTGTVYAEFQSRVNYQDENWYSLKNFKVYGDKQYGFVISQTKQSSLDIVYDFNEKPSYKMIDFKKK